MQSFVFVSGNKNKWEEVEQYFSLPITWEKRDIEEMQSLSLEEVVKHKAHRAYEIFQKPVLVEDTSLVFSALNGLPGPFIKWFLQSIGNEGLCTMLAAFSDRSCVATICFAVFDGSDYTLSSVAIPGIVPQKPQGKVGFGWDSIFIPQGSTKTIAEMTKEEYAQISFRKKALGQLHHTLTKNR